jgi:prepilin-type N-terminal cleavage/methylation domain-containing protein
VKRVFGFTLLEVLVAIAVAAMIISISSSLLTNLVNIRSTASEQNMNLKYELFLKLLNGDLEATTITPNGVKNIMINFENDNEIRIELMKPIIDPETRMIEIVRVMWLFTDKEVSRKIGTDLFPLKFVYLQMEHKIEEISENVYYLTSRIGDSYKNLILDIR